MKRRLVVLLLALAAVLAPASAAHADNNCPPGANCAIAINQQDNSSLFQFAWAIRHVLGDTVDQENGAVAYSSCQSCQTTAIAIEIVLVENPNPTNVSPQNVAAAVNVDCNLCDTFATAYQFVVSAGGPVRFTSDGVRELNDIRKEIKSWGDQHLSNDQIRALLPDVISRLKTVLATQLVPIGNNGSEGDSNDASGLSGNRPNAPPTTPTATTDTGTVDVTTPTTTQVTDTTEPTTTTAPTTTGDTTTTTP